MTNFNQEKVNQPLTVFQIRGSLEVHTAQVV